MFKSDNSLFHALFYSYIKTIFVLIFVIISLFSFIIDALIVNLNIRTYISTSEKVSDNLTYNLQQNITLAYTLASNEDVLNNLINFASATRAEQIDYDIALTEIFKTYTKYDSGVSRIKIYLPPETINPIVGYKTVQYLSLFNDPEWVCYFQPNLSSISLEYSANFEKYSSFAKDTRKIAVIVPVLYKKKHIAYLVMDIDKGILFSHSFSQYPCTVINNKGKIIYNTSDFEFEDSFFTKIARTPDSSHQSIYKNKQRFLMFSTRFTAHGFKIVQFVPYSSVATHRVIIVLGALSIMVLFCLISYYFIKRKALLFVLPLSKLSNAMKNSDAIHVNENLPVEIQTLYETYNQLLDENAKMMDNISHITQKQYKTEIKALLAQISPHFLYNTLNTVTWKAAAANQQEIAIIISKLAKLCKISYAYTSDFIQLVSEIQHMELYMELQKEAFRKNFDYEINLPEDLFDVYVPRFILQPIVENTIIHGFAQLSQNGLIRVNIQADESLSITIEDNGTGISHDIIIKLNSGNYNTEKYGIRNINQRIKMLCGDEYGIIFESNGYNYTKATISLPLIEKQQES